MSWAAFAMALAGLILLTVSTLGNHERAERAEKALDLCTQRVASQLLAEPPP